MLGIACCVFTNRSRVTIIDLTVQLIKMTEVMFSPHHPEVEKQWSKKKTDPGLQRPIFNLSRQKANI